MIVLLLAAIPAAAKTVEYDICIYSGTPAGIGAAITAAESGSKVILIEPTKHVGGMISNGLCHTDFRTFEGFTGTYFKHTQEVLEYYRKKYGPDSPQAKGSFRGTHAEPHVNRIVFERVLERNGIDIHYQAKLIKVNTLKNRSIKSLEIEMPGSRTKILAKAYIDCSYEGDLMAMAGVPYRIGREAKATYGESVAPDKADQQVQGYNFRLTMTKQDDIKVMPSKPAGYMRELFLDLLPLLESGKIKKIFCAWNGGMYKAQEPALPNEKYDINDVSHAAVRLSLPSINNAWPDGDAPTREKLFAEHLLHNIGMLYFLQNDDAVPEKFQEEARRWGLCKDEFIDSNHIPEQLYVREARRMHGMYTFTQRDVEQAPDDARAVFHADAIAMGDYGPNCHGTDHKGSRFGGRHTGEFYVAPPAYQVPYGSIVPKKHPNLLVPVALSASHVGFCALRLEPIWMALGRGCRCDSAYRPYRWHASASHPSTTHPAKASQARCRHSLRERCASRPP